MREARFLKDFRAGSFINRRTGLQNPFLIESWWHDELSIETADRMFLKQKILAGFRDNFTYLGRNQADELQLMLSGVDANTVLKWLSAQLDRLIK